MYVSRSDTILIHERTNTVEKTINIDLSNYTHICLQSLTFPKNYYVIGQNVYLDYQRDSTPGSLLIPPGNYSYRSLQAYINNALAGIISISYPNTTNSADTLKFTFTFLNCASAHLSTADKYLAHCLGFDENIIYNATPASPNCILVSSNTIDFQRLNMAYIRTNIIDSSQNNILDSFVLNNNTYGSYITYQQTDVLANMKRLNPLNQQTIRLEIFDENNDLIDFSGWCTYTLLLIKVEPYVSTVISTYMTSLLSTLKQYFNYRIRTDDAILNNQEKIKKL